jgi:hypothetical protein
MENIILDRITSLQDENQTWNLPNMKRQWQLVNPSITRAIMNSDIERIGGSKHGQTAFTCRSEKSHNNK